MQIMRQEHHKTTTEATKIINIPTIRQNKIQNQRIRKKTVRSPMDKIKSKDPDQGSHKDQESLIFDVNRSTISRYNYTRKLSA